MVKEALNFELPYKLNQEVIAHYPLLLYHFQTHDHSTPQLTRQIHTPEFTLTQPPNHLKTLFR
jgi:hypothetical protein